MAEPGALPAVPTLRIDLDAAGWAAVLARSGLTPPPGLEPTVEPGTDGAAAAQGAAGAWASAGLALLAGARLTVQVSIGAGDRRLRTVLGVADRPAAHPAGDAAGAALTTLADGGVQVSVFPGIALGAELARAVPPVARLAPAPEGARRSPTTGPPSAPVTGVLPLAALTDYPQLAALGTSADAGERLHLTAEQTSLAERLNSTTRGVMRALAAAPLRVGGSVEAGVTQAIWFGTDDGWVAAQPAPDLPGERMVRLRPVHPADLGTVLAPGIAQLLAGGEGMGAGPDHADGESGCGR